MLDSNFGRVVKAVALGAILVRGVGSNPTGCSFFYFRFHLSNKPQVAGSRFACTCSRQVRVAQWIARLPPKQKVVGSNPTSDGNIFA